MAARLKEAMVPAPAGTIADTLLAETLPVVVNRRLDGRFLGLAEPLEADAVLTAFPAVVVVRFRSQRREEDQLVATGLALALEAAQDWPVDMGCVVRGDFVDGHPVVRRDLFVIDDELRQQFIELRNEKARLAQEEIDPGLPGECPADCPFWQSCHGGGR